MNTQARVIICVCTIIVAIVIIFGIVLTYKDAKETKTFECYLRTFKEKNLFERYNITSVKIPILTEVYSIEDCNEILSKARIEIRKSVDENQKIPECFKTEIKENFINDKLMAKVLERKGMEQESAEVDGAIKIEISKKCIPENGNNSNSTLTS